MFELHFSRKVPAVKKFDCMLERACTEVFFSEKMQFRHSSSVDRFRLGAGRHSCPANDCCFPDQSSGWQEGLRLRHLPHRLIEPTDWRVGSERLLSASMTGNPHPVQSPNAADDAIKVVIRECSTQAVAVCPNRTILVEASGHKQNGRGEAHPQEALPTATGLRPCAHCTPRHASPAPLNTSLY